MPSYSHTPASRRFLPPSSSSVQSKSSVKTPAPLKKSLNLTRSSQPSSSARFSQTPHFKSPTVLQKDDIETSFEDEGSSPLLPSRLRYTPSYGPAGDDIEDGDDRLVNSVEDKPWAAGQDVGGGIEGLDNKDDSNDTRAISTRTDTLKPQRKSFTTPIAHKRRKLSTSRYADNSLIVTSPVHRLPRAPVTLTSDEEADSSADERDGDYIQNQVSPIGDSSSSLSPVMEPTLASSRFRTPNSIAVERQTENPLPPFARPSFKPLSSHLQSSSSIALRSDQTLPDAFSPSRRRGKLDYLANGAAETVRNWVLGIAAEESQNFHWNPTLQVDIQKIRVSGTMKDRSGRCALLSSEDGQSVLLIDQQGRPLTTDLESGSLGDIMPGSSVELQGGGTRWDLHLQTHGPGVVDQLSCSVCVLWKFRGTGARDE